MFQNTKLLVLSSILVIILGSIFLWFGLNPKTSIKPLPSPASSFQIESKESTQSAENMETYAVEGDQAYVTKVIDGDTIELQNGQRVRLLGIDTPETKDPRRPVGCFGKEASNKTKNLIEGKLVILQKDVSETDKYKRLLRYIFLPLDNGQILFVNDYLVREGFAKALTYPPDVKYNEQFREAERQARDGNKGLWGKC